MKKISPLHKRYLLIVGILLVVIFYLSKCKGTTQQPPAKSKEIHDTLTVIKYDNKKLSDSFNLILAKHYKADDFNNGQFVNLANQNTELAAINENLQRSLDYPDTCREVVNKLTDANRKYVDQTNKTIEQAKRSLIGLSQTVQTQKSYLSEKDKIINRITVAADSCDVSLKRAEKYNKQVKPKHELGLMISGMNDFSNKNFKPAIGAGLAYRNKRGLQIGASYYSNQTGSIFIIKPLIRL